MQNAQAPSIFLLSLPRSFSSQIYHVIKEMTQLRAAQWTTDGEILNLDRHILFSNREAKDIGALKYLRREASPETFHKATSYLSHCTSANGYIYKDVTQTFLLSDWSELKHYTTIYLYRPLADVAYSVLKRGWDWPAHAINRRNPSREEVLKGLILAEETLKTIPSRKLDFDQIIQSFETISEILPDYTLTSVHYTSDTFYKRRDEILKIRTTSEYLELKAEIETLKGLQRDEKR